MRKRQDDPWYVKAFTWVGVGVVLLGMGWCSHRLGLARATEGDIRALERQIEERCR